MASIFHPVHQFFLEKKNTVEVFGGSRIGTYSPKQFTYVSSRYRKDKIPYCSRVIINFKFRAESMALGSVVFL